MKEIRMKTLGAILTGQLLLFVCATVLCAQEIPQPMTPDAVKHQLDALGEARDSNDVPACAAQLKAIGDLKCPAQQHAEVMARAMKMILTWRLRSEEPVKKAVTALVVTANSERVKENPFDFTLLQRELELVMHDLPKICTPVESAGLTLETWNDFTKGIARMAKYDLTDPKNIEARPKLPPRPANYRGPVVAEFLPGIDPMTIPDSDYRKQYEKFLRDLSDYSTNALLFGQWNQVRLAYRSDLVVLLKTAYAHDKDSLQAGEDAIRKYITDDAEAGLLISALTERAVRPVNATQPRPSTSTKP
jgi:hypothetical protein